MRDVGALMLYLMKKHGTNNCCEMMEGKRAVRAQVCPVAHIGAAVHFSPDTNSLTISQSNHLG